MPADLPSVLDVRSITVVSGMLGLVMSAVTFFMWRSFPASIRGLREWAWAPLVGFVSALLFSGRGVLPDLVSVVGANMLLFVASLLYYAGSQQFLLGHSDMRRWIGVSAAVGAWLVWFTHVQPDYAVRLAGVTLAVCVLYARHAAFYLRRRHDIFGMRLMTTMLLVQATAAGLRLVSVGLGVAGNGLLEPNWVQMVYITSYAFTVLMMSITAVLMSTDRARMEFESLAAHDPLTGALNRRALREAAQAELQRARAGGTSLAVLMLDMDHFKPVNDRFGHPAGDAVLCEVVRRVQEVIGRRGLLGRHGGDEFVVLLPGASREAATALAERIRVALMQPYALPGRADEGVASLSASIGIGMATDEAATGVDTLLARADEALYQAKAGARARLASA